MAAYTYTKINWENEPSYNTPINETNLNHMDQAIFDLTYVKAEKEDAVFVNSISLDRKAGTTVGRDSVAAGYDTEATSISSVAIGTGTSAKNGQAVAGGYYSKALGNTSLALGNNCITRLNAAESQAIGNNCIAGSANQMVFGKYNVEDTTGTYAEIVGNGSSGNESNARTLDWQGNEAIAGDYTNGNGETLHGAYQAFIDGLPVDSESGNPCVITDAFNTDAKSVKLTLNPIQNLHGYSKPWVGGSGKNKLPVTLDDIKSINTSGTWSGNTYTRRNVVFTVLTDNDGNVTGIKANGTANGGNTFFRLVPNTYDIASGMAINGCPSSGSTETYCIIVYASDDSTMIGADIGSGYAFNSAVTDANVYIRIRENATASNLMFYPMLHTSGQSATFEPYTNICPISGRTQSVVTRTGKNLFNIDDVEIGVPWNGGSNSARARIIIPCIPNQDYKITMNGTNGLDSVYYALSQTIPPSSLAPTNEFLSFNSGNNNYITIGFNKANITKADVEALKLQVELGTTATSYVPYMGSESITRTYGTTIYGGSDDVTGEGAISDMAKIVISSVSSGYVQNNRYIATNLFDTVPMGTQFSNIVCDSLETVSSSDLFNNEISGISVLSSKGILAIVGYATKDALNAFLADHNITVCYKVATPTSIPLTAQNVTLLHGDNVLTTDADSVEASYSADIALYIDKKIAEGISQGNRSLSKGGSGDEEVKEEEKEEEKKEEIEIKEAEPLTKEVR